MFGTIRRYITGLKSLRGLNDGLESLQLATGRMEARQTAHLPAGAFQDAEFKVWSQWGEDGIIEHLLRHVPVAQPVFVEFGVENYREANTRFLLRNRNWSGLVIDGSPQNIAFIRNDPISWRHDLKAIAAFVTRDNINQLIADAGITGDIGLLSVDIDGNDYFVWDSISQISPRLVIAEYNAIFGASAAVSVPYAADFHRTAAHYSNVYWGCSLAALDHLAQKKGYILAGCNSNGNNAFFIRQDVAGTIQKQSPAAAFRAAKFRESRDEAGNLTFLPVDEARRLIAHMPLVDVSSGAALTVGDIGTRA